MQEPDRFGRSLRKLIVLVNGLRERGVEFVFLRESINETTRGGELVFPVLGAVAELERDLILERTMVGRRRPGCATGRVTQGCDE